VAALLLAPSMAAVLGHYAARFSVRAKVHANRLEPGVVRIGLALVAGDIFGVHSAPACCQCAAECTDWAWRVRVTGGSKRRLRIFAVTQITGVVPCCWPDRPC